MEVHIGMPVKPFRAALVGAVVIKDHMELLAFRHAFPLRLHHIIHEGEEILPFLVLCRLSLHRSRCDGQGGEEVCRPVPAIGAVHPRHNRSVVLPHEARLLGLRLYARLLVDADDDGILRRVEVQPHNVGSLLGKLRVLALAPAPMPPQDNVILPQYPPHRIRGASYLLGEGAPVPEGVPVGRLLLQELPDFGQYFLFAVHVRSPRPRVVIQAIHPVSLEPFPPFDDSVRQDSQIFGYVFDPAPLSTSKNHPCPVDKALLGFLAVGKLVQELKLLFCALYSLGYTWHAVISFLDNSIINPLGIIVNNIMN